LGEGPGEGGEIEVEVESACQGESAHELKSACLQTIIALSSENKLIMRL
jgi:hypothetical protein